MISKETKEQLINEYIKASGERKPAAATPKVKKPLIEDKLETDGTHTWGELTGTKLMPFKDMKTHVYEDEFWPEEMRGWIPSPDPYYVYTPEFFRAAVAIDAGLIVFSWGDAGGGKDASKKQICALRRIPYRRITGMDGMTPDMVLGWKDIQSDGTIGFTLGEAGLICRHGGMLVLSEPATMPAGVMFALQSAYETNGYLSLTDHPDPEMRMLPVSEHTMFALTSNVRGVGDNAAVYAAANNVMDASTANRIGAFIHFEYPSEEIETAIIKRHFATISDDFAKKVVKLGNLIRQGFKMGEIEWSWSLRNALPFIKMALIYGDELEGMRTTFFDRLSDDEKGKVRGFWKTVGFDGEL